MRVIQYKSGDSIHKSGDVCVSLELIIGGKVEIKGEGFSVNVKKGTIIGCLENPSSPYLYDYVAKEDTSVAYYEYDGLGDYERIVRDNFSSSDVLAEAASGMVVSAISKFRYLTRYIDKFINTLKLGYGSYKDLCELNRLEIQAFPFIDEIEIYTPEYSVPDFIYDYYDQLEIMPKEVKQTFFSVHISIPLTLISEAIQYTKKYLGLCTEICEYFQNRQERYFSGKAGNIFGLYMNLIDRTIKDNIDRSVISEIKDNVENLMSELGTNPLIDKKFLSKQINEYQQYIERIEDEMGENPENSGKEDTYKVILHSLDVILKFACMDEGEEDRFRKLVDEYKNTKDKNSSDDDVRKLRSEIANNFYNIYEAAFISTVESKNIPIILKMFFCFGYIDERLIGKENALILYKMAERIDATTGKGVYTIYDWLVSIYNGENEPSKNEFEQDYPAYLKAQRQSGYISEDMEQRYLQSNKEKVRFEIHNFFKIANRISSGRPSTFCPLISKHNIFRPLEDILVGREQIDKNWNIIKSIDYSCFYRQSSYQNADFHLMREPIETEVMPYVILMPVIGQRAGIWQETSGVRRDTSARVYIPIFTNEDLFSMQLNVAGQFRWEMCKKIQGARWNDVTDHSLTSDYFDYLQFYRKNSELSPDAKEKIKSALVNSKNSFRNVFVSDYISWIRYESQGSPRLNKVVKEIMYTYCPFSKAIRDKLRNNPMYSEMIIRGEIKNEKKHRLLELKYDKIKNSDGELPPEIKQYINFYAL